MDTLENFLSNASILVVDDTPANLRLLSNTLKEKGYNVRPVTDGALALTAAAGYPPDLILLDINMPGMNGFAVCNTLKSNPQTRDIPIIFISALDNTQDKVKAFELGGVDYVSKPFQLEEVIARVQTHLTLRYLQLELIDRNQKLETLNHELKQQILGRKKAEKEKSVLQQQNIYLQEEIKSAHNFEEIIGGSRSLLEVLQQVKLVSETDTTVLISGETGTGKELIAHAIHQNSRRSNKPLIKVNCAALPATLVESELFGHEKGAFSGATSERNGRFQLADGGTIFLDEIGEISEEIQVKLLRVLQEKEFVRVGGEKNIRVDVRLCAATNSDLKQKVKEGKFREDLFYRLNVFPITLPPLRNRLDDTELLAKHFSDKFTTSMGKTPKYISPETIDRLKKYPWPGNIRELQSVIERAIILSPGDELIVDDKWLAFDGIVAVENDNDLTLSKNEQSHIASVLQKTRGVIEGPKGAAKILDINPSTLRSRMKKLGIEIDDFQN